MSGRKLLPHDPPSWIDSTREIWFITLNGQPRGRPQLTAPERADVILDSVTWRYERRLWYPHLFLLMPDHLHALVRFPQPDGDWKKIVRDWKHWLAAKAGVCWQVDFFDHRLRREESYTDKARYILHNPVRAGLVAQWEDWPHVWFPPDDVPFTGLHR